MNNLNQVVSTVAPQASAPSIGSSAMLCELKISCWTGRKKDKLVLPVLKDALKVIKSVKK